jgi:CHAT domain-containing protein/tetratricopeptide (TPR) repeat protein
MKRSRLMFVAAAVLAVLACSGETGGESADMPERGSAPAIRVEPASPGRAWAEEFAPDRSERERAAREQPDSIRDDLARALRLAAASTPSAAAPHLAHARSLADAYAVAWADSFLVQQVARFEEAPPAGRRDMAAADSLLRAARVVFGQEGVPAAMRLWRESLRRATAAGDPAARAASLANLGAGFYETGDWDSAGVYIERGLRLAEATGDHRTVGNALGNLATLHKDRGDLAGAAELYRRASEVRPRSGDSRGLAADENNLGLIAWALGDLEGARKAFERALALNRSEGRDRLVALNLTNLGDLASMEGDYAVAETLYQEALEINRASGDLAETGFVLHDLGLLAARRGDYRRALDLLSQALAVHEQSGAALQTIYVRSDLAAVHGASGNLEGALAVLEIARRDEAGMGIPTVQAALAIARADLLVQLGGYQEADAEYTRTEQLYRQAGESAGQAAAHTGHALLRLVREDHAGALRHLELAGRAHEAERDRRSAAQTQLLEGVVRQQMGDTATALRNLRSAHEAFAELGDVAGAAAALSALGDLVLAGGAPVAAESLYRHGLEELGDRPVADVRWRLHAGLGRALHRQGGFGAAADQFRASIAVIEEVAFGLRLEGRRAGFLSDKWEPYAALALLEKERGNAAEAFTISERMRGRQTLAMLERGRLTTRQGPSEREQDLRRRVGELMREIEGAEPDPAGLREPPFGQSPVDAAREALAATQREYAELLVQLRVGDPGYARLVSPEPIHWREAARRLKPDMALLQYLVTDSGSVMFVVTRDTIAALDLDIRRAELANLVDFVRGVIERPHRPDGPVLWQAPLRRLHHHLIGPAERAGLLNGRRTLVIVPHAELHFLPFGALLAPEGPGVAGGRDRFLVERFDLVFAPSASTWSRLAAQPARPRSGRVLALAPRTDALPASRDEVAGIRAVHGRRASVLVDQAASKPALRAAVPRHDILHLASFGVLNKHNPLFSYIELAPSGDDDGRLEVHEVFSLGLEGQFVVLSACQTGLAAGPLADVPAGDDWVGLMHGFLQAGAGGVLASLWRVEDRATAELMQRFYRHLRAGAPEATALARAQRELLGDAPTADPFYWAGFVLSGAGGG